MKQQKNSRELHGIPMSEEAYRDCVEVLKLNTSVRWSFTPRFSSGILQDRYHQSVYKGNGRWKTKQSSSHICGVESWIVRRSAKKAEAKFLTYHRTWIAPDGYAWGIDQNGIKLFRTDSPKDDYHPTSSDVYLGLKIESLIISLEQNRGRRLQYEAQHAAEAAQVEGVWVCVADSLRAGNCLQGTMTFAQRHGLDPKRHYHAPEIVRMANGDAGRVRVAISAAVHRHRKELEQGFALLEEHQVHA